MESLLSKISAYHLISYALTGLILCGIYAFAHGMDINSHPVVIFGIVYLVGLTVSRIGSIFVESILRKIGFIKYADYKDFVRAEVADPKVSGLAEQSAFYRTLSTGFLTLTILSLFDRLPKEKVAFEGWVETTVYAVLMILFALSYRKQSDFVAQRVGVRKDERQSG